MTVKKNEKRVKELLKEEELDKVTGGILRPTRPKPRYKKPTPVTANPAPHDSNPS